MSTYLNPWTLEDFIQGVINVHQQSDTLDWVQNSTRTSTMSAHAESTTYSVNINDAQTLFEVMRPLELVELSVSTYFIWCGGRSQQSLTPEWEPLSCYTKTAYRLGTKVNKESWSRSILMSTLCWTCLTSRNCQPFKSHFMDLAFPDIIWSLNNKVCE